MSRYNVNYKPGGAIPKDVGVTIKMVKKQAKQETCPDGGCEMPPLAAVWLDAVLSETAPIPDALITVPGSASRGIGGNFTEGMRYLVIATMVNSDWFTNDVTGFIDMDGVNVSIIPSFESFDIPWDDGELSHVASSSAEYVQFGHQLAAVLTIYDAAGLSENELLGRLIVTAYTFNPATQVETVLNTITAEVRAPQPG